MAHQLPTTRRLLLGALFLTACVEVHDASDEAKKKAADSIGGTVYVGEAKPNAPTPSPDTFGPDSATPVRGGFGPMAIDSALRTDTAHTLDVIDTTPAARPTDADLAVLQHQLIVAVTGVAKA